MKWRTISLDEIDQDPILSVVRALWRDLFKVRQGIPAERGPLGGHDVTNFNLSVGACLVQ